MPKEPRGSGVRDGAWRLALRRGLVHARAGGGIGGGGGGPTRAAQAGRPTSGVRLAATPLRPPPAGRRRRRRAAARARLPPRAHHCVLGSGVPAENPGAWGRMVAAWGRMGMGMGMGPHHGARGRMGPPHDAASWGRRVHGAWG
jgi:hypothetical protein